MRISGRFVDERGDDPLHAHEARALDQHRGVRRRGASAAIRSSTLAKRARAGELGHRARAFRAGRPERLDAALPGVGAGLAMERRPLRRRPRPCRRAAASAAPAAPPGRRSRHAPNRDWRCRCRRPGSARPRRRPCAAAASGRAPAGTPPGRGRPPSTGQPAASAEAAAASALRTLCRPAVRSAKRVAPAGLCRSIAQWSPAHAAVAVTSAPAASPKVRRRRAPAIACQVGACSSSAGNTAMPSAPSASIAAPFSRATASTLAMNSRCSRCALLTRVTVGRAIVASARDLAGMVHAELDHRGAMRRAQAQQGQRQADVVVEVAFGGEAGVALPGAEDGGDHLRHRRLAVAAGHRHQRQIEALPPGRRELTEGETGIGHLEPGQAGLGQAALGQRGDGAGRLGLGQEVVRVEALAAQGDEQIAGPNGAGVAVHPNERKRRDRRPGSRPAGWPRPRRASSSAPCRPAPHVPPVPPRHAPHRRRDA